VGIEHLEAALARGRGAVLMTAHFGLPVLGRIMLPAQEVEAVAVGLHDPWVDESLEGSVWDRARTLRRMQAQLVGRRVCVFVVDSRHGRGVEAPFFSTTITVGLGGFALARQAGCPALPIFAVRRPDRPGFSVELGRPLALPAGPEGELPQEGAREFARLFESYAARFPDHLFAYQPLVTRARRQTAAGDRPSRSSSP
jgi:KDO2-lipid IV(A) lauroyltransferase